MGLGKIITAEDRNLDYLKDTVTRIVNSICNALEEVKYHYENLDTELCREVSFITSQELEDMYPDLTPKERENAYAREKKTIFIMQIGDLLKSGEKHDGRAPDYDDWKLNGDLLFWHEPLQCAMEISSMGIRVDAKTLSEQLDKAGCKEPDFPQNAFKQRTAPHYRRRHRPVQGVHASSAEGTCGRGTVLHLGRSYPDCLQQCRC